MALGPATGERERGVNMFVPLLYQDEIFKPGRVGEVVRVRFEERVGSEDV